MKKEEGRKSHRYMVNEKGAIDNVRGGDRWRVGCREKKLDSILQCNLAYLDQRTYILTF